jgi:hypothetical protein
MIQIYTDKIFNNVYVNPFNQHHPRLSQARVF